MQAKHTIRQHTARKSYLNRLSKVVLTELSCNFVPHLHGGIRISKTPLLPGDSPVSDSPFGSDDLEDNMSEASSDSHIIVTHPDEEDSAERRWRLAEQRGNDIRRAQSVPSPRVQGTSSYLKVMVVCLHLHHRKLTQAAVDERSCPKECHSPIPSTSSFISVCCDCPGPAHPQTQSHWSC